MNKYVIRVNGQYWAGMSTAPFYSRHADCATSYTEDEARAACGVLISFRVYRPEIVHYLDAVRQDAEADYRHESLTKIVGVQS